jgi:hypothetical protein
VGGLPFFLGGPHVSFSLTVKMEKSFAKMASLLEI